MNSYIYISLSLRDYYIAKGRMLSILDIETYNYLFYLFMDRVREFFLGKTSKYNNSRPITNEVSFSPTDAGGPWQGRIILKRPPHWTNARFEEKTLKLLEKESWVEMVAVSHWDCSPDMDLSFLEPHWGRMTVV